MLAATLPILGLWVSYDSRGDNRIVAHRAGRTRYEAYDVASPRRELKPRLGPSSAFQQMFVRRAILRGVGLGRRGPADVDALFPCESRPRWPLDVPHVSGPRGLATAVFQLDDGYHLPCLTSTDPQCFTPARPLIICVRLGGPQRLAGASLWDSLAAHVVTACSSVPRSGGC